MKTDFTYLPAYTPNAIEFMECRTVQSHAAFLLPKLVPGLRVLDCGCGPGTITLGIANLVAPGEVVGLDPEPSQIDLARKRAAARKSFHARFETGSIYTLQFADNSFDVVFAHALFEHLHKPEMALLELRRVLRNGGLVALRSPDWGGFLVFPDNQRVTAALEYYQGLQIKAGGDIHVGRKFKKLFREVGLSEIEFSASYECYSSLEHIGEYLAQAIDRSAENSHSPEERLRIEAHSAALRKWSQSPDGLFAQSWCEILGRKMD